MTELDIVLATEEMKITIIKLQSSVDYVKEKNSSRTDIIESMEQSVSDVTHALNVFRFLEKENRSSKELSSNLTLQNLILMKEIQELKENKSEVIADVDLLMNLDRENVFLKKRVDELMSELTNQMNKQ